MLKTLFPYIKLYKHYFWMIVLGVSLALLTLLASIFLLSLSGWFLASTAFVGFAGIYTFNYMLPAAGVRGAAIVRTAARYFERLANHDTTFKILAYLRTTAFKKILPFSASQLQQYQKADLLNRFITDIDNLDHLYLKLFVPILTALLVTTGLFIGLSQINLLLASIVALILLTTILVLPIIFYHAGKISGANIARQKSHYRTQLINYLQGQAELSLFNANHYYRQQLNNAEVLWLINQKKQTQLMSLATGLIVLIIGLMTTLIIYATADGIEHYDQPMIALFIFVGLSCGEILAPIPNAFVFLGQVLTSSQRMTEIMNQKPLVTFPRQGEQADLTQASVTFNNVTFCYPNQPLNVLENISFTIENGEHIALIGQTGCGKSTLLSLLTRTWVAEQGVISINHIPIEQYDEISLRNLMAVIPQVITIFSDTLRNNLLVGNEKASDQQLIAVLKQMGLEKLLATDEKLDLWLGESGRALSGGEKRRIGIARALLHDAPLILMDEPTESLDNETEKQILNIIKQHYANKTLIMVTHRLSEHNLFDRTFLLNNKNIIK